MSNVQRVLIEVSAEGAITAFPDPVNVRGPEVLLVFRVKSADWQFPEQGAIVVHNGGSTFPYPSWTVSPPRPESKTRILGARMMRLRLSPCVL